jgi:hypothetical protein
MKFLAVKRRVWGGIGLFVGAAALIFLVCTIAPNQNGNAYSITLAVDDKSSTEATFSGKLIQAFLTFRDSVYFEDLAWHLGSGSFKYPAITPGKKIKNVQVGLFWTIMPTHKDTAKKCFYDSIYVSMGGEQYRSNPARINVTNLPPVIDSVKINTTVFKSGDTLKFLIKSTDTITSVPIKVSAHSLDMGLSAPTISCVWYGAASRIAPLKTNTFNAFYLVPLFNCVDTIDIRVDDKQGGDDVKTMIISTQKNANRPPIIDSISAKDTLFVGNSGA